jgi:hypothetical protein
MTQIHTEEARAAVLKARAAALDATIEMMVAENDECDRKHVLRTYGPADFQKAIDDNQCHRNGIVSLMMHGSLE